LAAFVNVVAKEQVIIRLHIAAFLRGFPNVKEAHKVNVVAVNVAKNLNRGLQRINQGRLRLKDVKAFKNQLQDLFFF